jgi:hypothetical protein
MTKNSVWYGYLEAGDKSTAVALDERLETGNPDTIYLFNLARKEIIQYNRNIARPKLRELREDEDEILPELKSAYLRARRHFKVRTERPLPVADRKAKGGQEKKMNETDDTYSEHETEFEPSADDDWSDVDGDD